MELLANLQSAGRFWYVAGRYALSTHWVARRLTVLWFVCDVEGWGVDEEVNFKERVWESLGCNGPCAVAAPIAPFCFFRPRCHSSFLQSLNIHFLSLVDYLLLSLTNMSPTQATIAGDGRNNHRDWIKMSRTHKSRSRQEVSMFRNNHSLPYPQLTGDNQRLANRYSFLDIA